MKLKQYLFSQLAYTFFPIFLGLYFITSIVILVQIASLTSVITMDIYELFRLYLYSVPTIIFYTLPVTFFISLGLTISKLSNEYEMIVITSFGLNPINIIKIFLPLTFFVSIALLIISVGLIPKSKYLNETFMDSKKKEANFNIKASEFGQKFGDWLIYIDSKEDKTYGNVKLFQTKNNKDQFIIADHAILDNDKGELSFKLYKGKSFHIENETFNQIDYQNMTIFDTIKKNEFIYSFIDSYSYWKYYLTTSTLVTDEFAYYILLSFFPLISMFLVIIYGYYNPRYEKSKIIQWSVFYVVIYYLIISVATKELLLHSIYVVPVFWILVTYYLYTKSIKQQY
ncbi:MAG: permease [Arcobacter sp.]|nr:MAG: permease [Arcobacter sp.]